jgi:hypothetical protein
MEKTHSLCQFHFLVGTVILARSLVSCLCSQENVTILSNEHVDLVKRSLFCKDVVQDTGSDVERRRADGLGILPV